MVEIESYFFQLSILTTQCYYIRCNILISIRLLYVIRIYLFLFWKLLSTLRNKHPKNIYFFFNNYRTLNKLFFFFNYICVDLFFYYICILKKKNVNFDRNTSWFNFKVKERRRNTKMRFLIISIFVIDYICRTALFSFPCFYIRTRPPWQFQTSIDVDLS